MNVRILHGTARAGDATGHAVIIDVFRAFTTAAFCVAAGARQIILVASHEEALAMKRSDPELFLTGEIAGRPIPGFDVGNSPSAIERLDLAGRRVVQRTSAGTQAVVAAAARAHAVVAASFVVADATVRYLRANADEVTLVATDQPAEDGTGHEDEICATYLEALLTGGWADRSRVLDEIWRREIYDWPEWFPRRDAELASQIDRFDFALPVTREGSLLVARPVIV